jgi:endonuclease-8
VERDAPLKGQRIESVESRGKHLLMHFSGGLTLRIHLRMNGSLHIYRPGEKWKRPSSSARIVVETEDFVAVAFDIQEAELLSERQVERHEDLSKLGPDVLTESFDPEEVIRRARKRGHVTVAELLLNQRVVAGIGNVYKSETLFEARVNPFLTGAELSDADWRRILEIARRLMNANVVDVRRNGIVTYTGYRRTTNRSNPAERMWVYGRIQLPCRRCGAEIEMRRQGLDVRSTYFCRTCQGVPPAGE